MAFRASGKLSSSTQSKPEETPLSADSFSVEDLVGEPVSEVGEKKLEVKSSTLENQTSNLPPRAAGIASGDARQNPTAHFQPPTSKRFTPGGSYHRPSYQNGPPAGGGFRREWGNADSYRGNSSRSVASHASSFSRPPTGGSGQGSFTQDVDVPTETAHGMLDIMPEGHGFLRPKFTPSEQDVYISLSQIRRFLLRNGDVVEGQARQPKDNERYWGLLKVEKVNDLPAEQMEKRPKFEDLTPVYPNKQLVLETGQLPLSTRILDLIAPIGFGQRGLIVSPPKAGKTTILKELAAGIAANYPQVHLMAALIGERPEEVTDITRSVKGEVLASNFDESPAEQTRIAEVALDRAKRLVEMGRDVVILLDSITRLARAYNLVVNPSGRTLSGGFDPAALYPAKRFLGAARCVEPFADAQDKPLDSSQSKRVTVGGSLTVIGTALVETGSRMDDLIYEEFKGTGNMELHLSRILQERRVFPAIDVGKSGTRHDELLLGEEAMKKVTTLRHMLSMLSDEERTVMLIERLGKTKTNAEFLDSLARG